MASANFPACPGRGTAGRTQGWGLAKGQVQVQKIRLRSSGHAGAGLWMLALRAGGPHGQEAHLLPAVLGGQTSLKGHGP